MLKSTISKRSDQRPSVSLKTLAEHTGLSTWTVSLALRNDARVAPRTRNRVLAVAERMGYEPHAAGRALATGRTHLIGFMNDGALATSYWNIDILSGLAQCLEAFQYRITIFESEPWEEVHCNALRRRMVDGLVLSVRFDPRFLTNLTEHAVPVVAVDPIIDVRCDRVEFDERQGVGLAMQHLFALGHRRIAYIGSNSQRAERIHQLRWTAFVEEMSAAGLPSNAGGASIGDPGMLLARALEHHKPTALVCFSDDIAAHVFQELSARQLRVPSDLSVVGIDDAQFAALLTPPLTTVRVPFTEMGAAAGRALMERLDDPTFEAREVVLAGELVVRASTAPVSGT